MRILGIETSCDETAAAVVEVTEVHKNIKTLKHRNIDFEVLSNVISSQVKIHAKTGGVVPEVAARAHVEAIVPVVERALKEINAVVHNDANRYDRNDLRQANRIKDNRSSIPKIDAIAVTAGPGLATSLLVGVEVARTLSWLWKKPVVAVNHLAGHVYANCLPPVGETRNSKLETNSKFPISNFQFPILALIVSGGHTELVLMKKHLDFKIIGETRDDAAGEAFDKVAKMLGLGYPGGPAISQLAVKWKSEIRNPKSETNSKSQMLKSKTTSYVLGSRSSISFPRPMIDSPNFDFSFSGLKTAVLYYLRQFHPDQNNVRPDIILSQRKIKEVCYEFQEAVVDVLAAKTVRAAKKYKVKTVLLGGGVAANKRLREQLQHKIQELDVVRYTLAPFQYTTDNAAMIAAAGYFMARVKQFTPWQKLDVDPSWKLGKKFQPLPR